ncbi:polyprenyl synthetase family protein [Demequina capsici]|uniref:Polyprenyl synthetase family protein n=1 Tax=Demequina capsici TaxID=3075620 RepID=A0AA96JBZ0_9MICO|nr:polyprenyl synthetase family protein [Demequina sp. PMTSA13]WNM28588.1 polyprenyl synthetase family protein [Demequina sp. PMTSA13]
MPANPSLPPFDALRARVEMRMSEVLADTADAVAPAGVAGTEVIEVLEASSKGGKRLRALLTMASFGANGGADDDRAAVSVAAALEWFQTAALIHDDVLDGSDTRRGEPAAHRRFATLHAHLGEDAAGELGRAAGVLAGDIALMTAHRALDSALVVLPDPGRTASLFASMEELVTAGQYLDMRIAAAPLESVGEQRADILATMRCKTASYSAEHPLALGAALAGAEASRIDAMRSIGVPLGIAFQLRDDVLGLVGSPAVTGKPAGDDVREGKRTLLVWHAWTHGTQSHRTAIAGALGRRDATPGEIGRAVDAIVDAGGLDAAEWEIAALTGPALAALEGLGLQDPGVTALRDLCTRLVTRSS